MICRLCGSSHTKHLGQKDDEDIYECVNCSFVFIKNYCYSTIGGECEEGRNSIELMNARLSFLNKPKTLLDFGCGHGLFTKYCNSIGIETVGIDQDTDIQLHTLENLTFDAITLVEVLEHLYYPLDVLKTLKKHLNKNGSIFIDGSFLDTEMLIGRKNKEENPLDWEYVVPKSGHISFFNQKSMEYASTILNLTVERCSPHNFKLLKG